MKNLFKISAFMMLILVFNCSEEDATKLGTSENANIRIIEGSSLPGDANARATIDDPCYVTDLIAGQNTIVGTVSVESDGVDLSIVYRTTGSWTMTDTHMSIGNCAEQWIPVNGGGNPKVGQFEAEAVHVSETLVIYMIAVSALDENYCFAAHADVTGNGNESAWAEGVNFEGRQWAMFIEDVLLSDCDLDVIVVDDDE